MNETTRGLDLDAIEAQAEDALPEQYRSEDVQTHTILALVAEVRRLRDPNVMLDCLIQQGKASLGTSGRWIVDRDVQP